jgi:hypothetical protein
MAFATYPKERAYQRDVLLAVELLDPSTSEILWQGLTVTVSGLANAAIVNRSGRFVWTAEPNTPQRVLIAPGDLPFEPEDLPAPQPPARLLRIVLRPRPGYAPVDGVTALVSTVWHAIQPNPVPTAGAQAWLEYVDGSAGPGGPWVEGLAPRSLTSASGDFIALLRLDASAVPDLDVATGWLRTRLRLGLGPALYASPEFLLAQGRTGGRAPFEWAPP